MQQHLQTAVHGSGLFWLLSLLLILPNWSLLSDLVCRKKPSWKSWKAYCWSVEKKIPNSVGARTHPCFTPLVFLKGWDEVQSKLIVLWVFRGRMTLCWEGLVHILFSSGFWTVHPYCWNQRLWWGQWKLRTVVCTVPCILLVVVWGRRHVNCWPLCSETALCLGVDVSGQYL